MTDNQSLKLISFYLIISDLYEAELFFHCQRYSNFSVYEFTDIEIITIYLFAMIEEQRFTNKQIYDFSQRYLKSWFPKLPTYVAFNTRLNNLASVFEQLTRILIKSKMPDDSNIDFSLLDSMPIITCSGKRKGKIASSLTDKGYCAAKNMYYYGMKLHLLAFQRNNKIPFPESFVITPASESDLNVFKQYWSNIESRKFWGDKIYCDNDFFKELYDEKKSVMFTPVKAVKGQPESLKQRDKAYNDLFSTAVSKIRQPIESFFNWLIQKTDIQRASKVRSTNGLLIHVFGKLTVAFIGLIFNS